MSKGQPFLKRFWDKVQIKGPEECWPWAGGRLPKGYGHFSCGSGRHNMHAEYAHIIAWELHYRKPFPDGKIGRHSCNHPWCVNPRHVKPGTYRQNTMDMIRAGNHYQINKTHCKWGHLFSDENTYINRSRKRPFRVCRICLAMHQRSAHHVKCRYNQVTFAPCPKLG